MVFEHCESLGRKLNSVNNSVNWVLPRIRLLKIEKDPQF